MVESRNFLFGLLAKTVFRPWWSVTHSPSLNLETSLWSVVFTFLRIYNVVFLLRLLSTQWCVILVIHNNQFVFVFQNRPSVITCAPANNRNCNLSHCPVSHNGCSSLSNNYRRINSKCTHATTDTQTTY